MDVAPQQQQQQQQQGGVLAHLLAGGAAQWPLMPGPRGVVEVLLQKGWSGLSMWLYDGLFPDYTNEVRTQRFLTAGGHKASFQSVTTCICELHNGCRWSVCQEHLNVTAALHRSHMVAFTRSTRCKCEWFSWLGLPCVAACRRAI
jgi:hypothetical protein